jgi:hypothetical protein
MVVLAGMGAGFQWMSLEQLRIVRSGKKIWKKSQRELTITASDGSWRGFLPLHRWHGACDRCPPSGFWGVLVVEKGSLDWRWFEGKRLGERRGAPTILFIGVAERSWPCIVVHIPRNLKGGEASLTESSSGRLEFKLSHIRLTGLAKLRSECYSTV